MPLRARLKRLLQPSSLLRRRRSSEDPPAAAPAGADPPASSPAVPRGPAAVEPEAAPALFGVPAPDRPRELVLYKFDTCPYCVRVFRALDALGVAVAMEDVRIDPSARWALQQATGRTTVPCLFVDGEPLFESLDIVAWLEAYAGATGTHRSS